MNISKPKVFTIFLSIAIFLIGYFASEVVQASSSAPGSATDPLVTRSYLESFPGKTVIITRNDDARDAMAASAIVSKYKATILYTDGKSSKLNEVTRKALATEIKPTKIIIIGGPRVITPEVEAELKSLFGTTNVIRIAGTNGIETSVQVTKYVMAN